MAAQEQDMEAKKDSGDIPPAPRAVLRYQHELLGIESCPGPPAPFNGPAYRSVHADFRHSFEPTAVIDPARLQRASSMEKRCSLWGVSMFESLEQLRSMVKRVERTHKNFRNLVGHHYAELVLTPNDGQRTNASRDGHFDLHPSISFDPTVSVRLHKELPP